MYFKNNRPVFYQIADDIERKIYGGEYALGQKLPSIRELGLTLGVNPNTIVHVYDELESRGLIITESTSGKYVVSDEKKIEELKRKYLEERNREFLSDIKEINLSVDELILKIYEIEGK